MKDALYHREGELYVPTERTNSPWDSRLLHGGAIAGIMAHVIDRHEPDPEWRILRLTHDLCRPAPRVPLTIVTETLRAGQRIQLIQARMLADSQEVARSTALRGRVQPVELPDHAVVTGGVPEGPEGLAPEGFLGGRGQPGKRPPGLNAAIEMRRVSGFAFKGEGTAWLRIDADVVAGEPTTAISYMGMMSDFGNGIGQLYLGGKMGCINADIDLHLNRYPDGEWICLESRTHMEPTGLGTTHTRLYDTRGPIGRVDQCLVLRPMQFLG